MIFPNEMYMRAAACETCLRQLWKQIVTVILGLLFCLKNFLYFFLIPKMPHLCSFYEIELIKETPLA